MTNSELQSIDRPVFVPVEPEAARPTGWVAEERATELRAAGIYANAAFRASEGGWGVHVLPWA